MILVVQRHLPCNDTELSLCLPHKGLVALRVSLIGCGSEVLLGSSADVELEGAVGAVAGEGEEAAI